MAKGKHAAPAGAAPSTTTPATPQAGTAQQAPVEPPRRRGARAAWIVLAVLVVAVAGAYAAGVAYFSQRFLPNTRIGGIDVSLMTADEAHDAVKGAADGYTLTLEAQNFELEIAGDDVSYAVDAAGIEGVAGSPAWLWPASLLPGGETALDLPVSYDRDALAKTVRSAVKKHNATYEPVEGTEIAYFAHERQFVPASYLTGEQIDADDAVETAEEALRELAPEATVRTRATAGPAEDVSDGVQDACDAANALLGCDMGLTMGGSEVARIDSDLVQEWVSFDGDLSCSIDYGAVDAWSADLADKLTTAGKARTYTRADGKEVAVDAGEESTYGWVVDADALAELVRSSVENRSTEDAAVPVLVEGTGYNAKTGADWGAYVDVDLSEQHARYYDGKGELIWESGIVSGNPNLDNDTPTGVYQLNAKKRDIVLRGQIDPETGEPSYESPVSYWMAFIGNSYGLHDASWQPDANFENPNAYLTSGSHGCVNLPPSKAAELYSIVEVGDVVVVHK